MNNQYIVKHAKYNGGDIVIDEGWNLKNSRSHGLELVAIAPLTRINNYDSDRFVVYFTVLEDGPNEN